VPFKHVSHIRVVSRSILWFTLTFRDRSRKSSFAILSDRISMPGQESAPRKVRVNPYCAVQQLSHCPRFRSSNPSGAMM
jgi:hypothetical protein